MRERSLGETTRDLASRAARILGRAGRRGRQHLEVFLGGPDRTRVIFLLAAVLALSSADAATVGASAIELRQALNINNTDIGLLVAVTSVVAAVASIPFGVLADRAPRTRTLGICVFLWGGAMVWSATVGSFGKLLLARLFLGIVTAAAGPIVASLVGDLFSGDERGKIYGYILTGELLGAGIGFAVTGDIAALSWRAAFLILAIPAFFLAWFVFHLPEPVRTGGRAPGSFGSFGAPAETDAQRLVRARGIVPDHAQVAADPARMGLIDAARYVLRVRTNVILIVASAAGYYFLAGVQVFGVEFVRKQYRVDAALANLLMLVIGGGAVIGILAGGALGDSLLKGGHVNGRILVSALAAALATLLFVPALLTRSLITAVPYVTFAALALSAQRAPMDAARLDIMPPPLWGRAEGIRSLLRTGAQALAPLLFGLMSDYVFGGGRSGLQWTFLFMLLPLGAGTVYLFKALKTYPRDIATAAAAGTVAR
ncbi:MAG TPA: MFS transporter [Actinomycetota bacterium]|nr:MFS transporter [Actinomycetota bacterium]